MSISDFLEKFSAQEVVGKISELDPILKDIIDGDVGGHLFETILARYQFDFSYFPELMMLVSLYLTRLISNQEFVDQLARLIPEKYLAQFLQELEDKLWSSYDLFLNRAGIVYKQLTKLTPRPIATVQAQEAELKVREAELAQLLEQPVSSASPTLPTQPQAVSAQVQEAPVEAEKKLEEVVIAVPQTEPAKPSPELLSSTEPVKSKLSSESARISFEALKNFVPRKADEAVSLGVETEKVVPKIQPVKFEVPKPVEEMPKEIHTEAEEKSVKIPQPPKVPKLEVRGKEVIDLSNFGLEESRDK